MSVELLLFITKLVPAVIVPTERVPTVPLAPAFVRKMRLLAVTEVLSTVTVPAERVACPIVLSVPAVRLRWPVKVTLPDPSSSVLFNVNTLFDVKFTVKTAVLLGFLTSKLPPVLLELGIINTSPSCPGSNSTEYAKPEDTVRVWDDVIPPLKVCCDDHV